MSGLKVLAEFLREDVEVVHGETSAPAVEPVAEARVEEPVDVSLLMAGSGMLSGSVEPVLDERGAEASELLDGDPRDQVIAQLHTIFDPEIPVDIFELGLIYDVEVREDDTVGVRMTLTSPNCPAAQSLPSEVEAKVKALDWVRGASVEVVFDPPWTPDLMSEAARLELNV